MSHRRRSISAAVLSGLAIAWTPGVVGEALGQWAIGDGGALDRNLRVGGARRIPGGRNFSNEMKFRNAMVTGNTPQGLQFRGEVGYTSPFEFRGIVGSELSDAFRRDALYSGLSGYGIRGTDALQYQYAMTTGSAPPPSLTGTLTTHRFGGGVYTRSATGRRPVGVLDSNNETITPTVEVDPYMDERGKSLWTLRSTSAYTSSRNFRPSNLKMYGTPEGEAFALTASPLRGIEQIHLGRVQDVLGDRSPAPTLANSRMPTAGERGQVPPTNPNAVPIPKVPGARMESPYNVNSELTRRYDAYEEWRDGWKPEGTVQASWYASIQAIREHFATPELDPLAEKTPETESDPEPDPFRLTPGQIDILRNAPGRIDSLLLTDPDLVDAYGQHMKAGESLLTDGRFFEAEERFTRALAHQPGDEIAAAARIHAQIGAGLYVSAALNLRGHLQEHPETIGMRFADHLLPGAARLGTIIARLQSDIANENNSMRGDSALLLAYLGYQTRDNAALRSGLETLESVWPTDRLPPLLRSVWTQSVDPGSP